MLGRTLETEYMDTPEEASGYDAMDHTEVNRRFAADFLAFHGPARAGIWIDVGTGTARIPMVLAELAPGAKIVAADAAQQMLLLAGRLIERAGHEGRIGCTRADGKHLPFESGAFKAVVSNSIVHHIPEPLDVIREMARLVAPGGTVFVRDLMRPGSVEEVNRLVELYAGQEAEPGRSLFEASLHAALTVDEMRALVTSIGAPAETVKATSDRHWTWAWRRGAEH